ncbi:hypothetical protein JQ636_11270 [Bradyrhizobium japonicum]|uniref:hypothetical protein n=1 Tax=Bradyrhizobium japonicum TaxID=375 RepID=UPI001BA72BD7|nr:hypothetical protein [Bradyrhizobium japonicum]MBR0804120.1 hypothetical protein [Bradyrhizobium japonicum]
MFKQAGRKDIVALASMASRALIPHELKAEVEQVGGLLPVRIIAVPVGMFVTQEVAKQNWEHERPTPLLEAITSPKPENPDE